MLRLYDEAESKRSYGTEGTNVLLVLDEAEPALVDATMAIVAAGVRQGARPLDAALVEQWLGHRNDVSALEALIQKGFVVDTMEISAPWSRLDAIYTATTAALRAVPGCLAATAHQSHSYPDGACLYFTFAARPAAERSRGHLRRALGGGHPCRPGGRWLAQPPPRRRSEPGRGSCREALGDAFEVLAAREGRARPARHPEPGQARPAVAVRRGRVAPSGAAVKMVP